MNQFQNLNFTGLITDIQYINTDLNHIIVCTGSDFLLYDNHLNQFVLIQKYRVFNNGQRIHGFKLLILFNKFRIITFSNRQLKILDVKYNTSSSPCLYRFSELISFPLLSENIWNAHPLFCHSSCTNINNNNNNNNNLSHAKVQFSPYIESFELAIGFASNRIEIWSVNTETITKDSNNKCETWVQKLHSAGCEDKSLLYCLEFYGACIHSLSIIGGTVFSALLFWDIDPNQVINSENQVRNSNTKLQTNKRPIKHKLTGHDGVIFHIRANSSLSNPFTTFPDELLSVSDDRTVRLWKYNTNTNSYLCNFTAYGHEARVWRALNLIESNLIISSGEDNSIRVWDKSTAKELVKFESQRGGIWSLAYHSGTTTLLAGAGDSSIRIFNIKSFIERKIEISNNNYAGNNTPIQANCVISIPNLDSKSAERAVNLAMHVMNTEQNPDQHSAENNHSEDRGSRKIVKPAKVKSPAAEFVREMLLFDQFNAILATSLGRLLHVTINSSESKEFTVSSRLITQCNHSVAICCFGMNEFHNLLAYGDQRGGVFICQLLSNDNSFPVHPIISEFKTGCMFIKFLYFYEETKTELILIADAIGDVKLFEFDIINGIAVYVASFRLPIKCRLTCALLLDSVEFGSNTGIDDILLLCGDAKGNVYSYSIISNESSKNKFKIIIPQSRVLLAHETMDLTQISYNSDQGSLYSAGKNNYIIQYELKFNESSNSSDSTASQWYNKHIADQQSKLNDSAVWNQSNISRDYNPHYSLVIRRSYKVPLTTIEKLIFPSNSTDLICCGFDYQDFVVYNVTRNSPMFRMNIGGSKRPFDYNDSNLFYARHNELKQNEGELCIVNTGIKSLYNESEIQLESIGIGVNSHSRLTQAICLIPNENKEIDFIITASEDHTMRIFRVNKEQLLSSDSINRSLSSIGVLSDHPDVIRDLCLVSINEHSHIVYSVGGKDYLHATLIMMNKSNNNTENMEEKQVNDLIIRNLSGIGGKVFKNIGKNWLKQSINQEERMDKMDIRIMSCTAFPIIIKQQDINHNNPTLHCVCVGNSSGIMKVYLFDVNATKYYFLTESSAHSSPIISMDNCIVELNSTPNYIIVSGSTNGYICIWNLTSLIKLCVSVYLNNSNQLQWIKSAQQTGRTDKSDKIRKKQYRTNNNTNSIINNENKESIASPIPTNEVQSLELFPLHQSHYHQLGVNCLCIHQLNSSQILIVSGGDDQSIHTYICNIIELEKSFQSDRMLSWNLQLAHFSSIKAIHVLSSYNLIYTSGYDQRLKVWEYNNDIETKHTSALELKLVHETTIELSDVSAIESNSDNKTVFVVGQGILILKHLYKK